jgi:cytochrome P450
MSRFDELIGNGKEPESAVVDIVEWANFATFDIIGELSWSRSYDCLANGTGHAFMGVLLHFQAVLIGASISYYAWLNAFMAKITPKSAFQMLENVFEDGRERLEARMRMDTAEHPDLISHINAYNSKSSLSEKLSVAEIEQNVLAIIVAGSDTLTTAFSGAFHHLLAHPEKLNRLISEVRTKFQSSAEINGSAVARLPYLNAVIDETLRMCPPIPYMLRRQNTSNETVTVAGNAILPGTTASVWCYSMFRSAQHFSAPEIFEPMRFLAAAEACKDSECALSHNNLSTFYPFSLGPHNCLGQPLARLEMRLLLALFLYNYNVSVPRGETLENWTDQKIYWTWEKAAIKGGNQQSVNDIMATSISLCDLEA